MAKQGAFQCSVARDRRSVIGGKDRSLTVTASFRAATVRERSYLLFLSARIKLKRSPIIGLSIGIAGVKEAKLRRSECVFRRHTPREFAVESGHQFRSRFVVHIPQPSNDA